MLEAEKEGPAGGGRNENTEGGEIMRAFCFVFFILSFAGGVASIDGGSDGKLVDDDGNGDVVFLNVVVVKR